MKVIKVVGGLGSQMFAYSLFLALRHKNKETICDFSWFKYNKQHNGSEIKKIFRLEEKKVNFFLGALLNSNFILYRILRKVCEKFRIIKYFKNKSYNFNNEILENKKNIIYDNSCWTSYRYFENISNEIKSKFNFPRLEEEKNVEIAKKIEKTNSVALHVRHGDYLESNLLKGLCELNYYQKCINYIEKEIENPYFFIFSDDIEWCKENFKLKNCYYINWNTKEKSFRDMQLMSLCKHNIIPNSSFSWWGAYLNKNPNKVVLTPERWVNEVSEIMLKDMNPSDWIIIKN